MRQGADRAALKERKDDLYETPDCAVHALMRHYYIPHHVWDPCAGRGAISRILKTSGRSVITSDLVAYEGADEGIETPIDFLMETKYPENHKTLIINPPYKLADDFIRHGLYLGCTVVALLRLMAIEGASRSDLIDRHLYQIFAGIERLPTMHREGWEGKRQSNSGAPFAWFEFLPKPRSNLPIELRRISWRNTNDTPVQRKLALTATDIPRDLLSISSL